jgi:hypothetical protein
MVMRKLPIMFCLTLATASQPGCLAGERPPLSELYPEPAAQVPSVTGSATEVEQRYEVQTTPGATVYYGQAYPDRPYYYPRSPYPYPGGPYYYPYQPYSYERARRLPPGTARWAYPSDEVRCDNLERACLRWSGRQGIFVPDQSTTRQYFGDRAARHLNRYGQQ